MTPEEAGEVLIRRHLRVGWVLLLVYTTLGLVLETFHGFKIRWYVDLDNETRRLMWTLAHAHGVLLGLVNIAASVTFRLARGRRDDRPLVSVLLLIASVLMPVGFLLGGWVIHQGDPGLGVLLSPAGGVALVVALVAMVRGLWNPGAPADP